MRQRFLARCAQEQSHDERLATLEADGEVDALAQRLQAVTSAHARHAKGVEEASAGAQAVP